MSYPCTVDHDRENVFINILLKLLLGPFIRELVKKVTYSEIIDINTNGKKITISIHGYGTCTYTVGCVGIAISDTCTCN